MRILLGMCVSYMVYMFSKQKRPVMKEARTANRLDNVGTADGMIFEMDEICATEKSE